MPSRDTGGRRPCGEGEGLGGVGVGVAVRVAVGVAVKVAVKVAVTVHAQVQGTTIIPPKREHCTRHPYYPAVPLSSSAP